MNDENSSHFSPSTRFFVLGSHALAKTYGEQILKARDSGKISFENLTWIPENYTNFILHHINIFKPGDILIPDHTAKHVLFDVFLQLAKSQHSEKNFLPKSLPTKLATPFFHAAPDNAVHALSYATWSCPLACDEPAICPHIEAPRTWDFFTSFLEYRKNLEELDWEFYDFGCFPVIDQIGGLRFSYIDSELKRFTKDLSQNKNGYAIATHSRCHGIIGGMEVTPSLPTPK